MKTYMENWNSKKHIPTGKRCLLTALLWLTFLPYMTVQAQENKKDSLPPQFDATDQAFIKRYRYPDAVPFNKKDWKSNFYLSFFGGIDRIVPRSYSSFNIGPTGGIGAGLHTAPAHSFRLSLYGGTFTRSTDNASLTRFGLQTDYLFNISAYTNGYNPGRFFEISLLAGLGYQYSIFDQNREHVGELHAGLQLKLHPSSQLDIFLEPRLGLATDGIDHSFQQNWHRYDLTYGAVIGLNYRLKKWTPIGRIRSLQEENFWENTFIDYAVGTQMQLSRLTREIGTINSIGSHTSVSFGKWIAPLLALRVSLFSSNDTWHQKVIPATDDEPEEVFYEMSSYMGGRLEGMFNLLRLINKKTADSPWGVNLLLGGELGYMWKESYQNPARGGYMGLTGGVQLKRRVSEDISIFLEPRFTLASYTALSRNDQMEEISERYADHLFSLNIGVELQRSSQENHLARSLNRELFKRSFFVSAGGGIQSLAQSKRYNLKQLVSPTGMVAAGYAFSPLSAVRVGAEYGLFKENGTETNINHQLIGGSLMYMLNLTNLMNGYDPERRFDIQLLAGLTGTACTKVDENEKTRFTVGERIGLQASYRVYKGLAVFLEPTTTFFPKESMLEWNKLGSDMLMSLHAGLTYGF